MKTIDSLHLWFPEFLLLRYTPKFQFSQPEDRQHIPTKQLKTSYTMWCKNPEDHHLSYTYHENLNTYIVTCSQFLIHVKFFSCHVSQNILICELPKSTTYLFCQPYARTCLSMACTHNKHLYEFRSGVYLSRLLGLLEPWLLVF